MRFRRNFRNAILLVLILYLVFATKKNKTSTATNYYTATTALNVRTGTGTEFPISFTLQKGDEVEFLSKEKNWYKIKYLGKVGYAHSKFLKFSRTTNTPIVTKSIPFQEITNVLIIGTCVLLAIYITYIIYSKLRRKYLLNSVTTSTRGTSSERDLVLKLLKCRIPAKNIFHDLYVIKYKDHFSQIDLVAVTEVGIIVFEVKDYSGWIYGSGNQQKWTKVLSYGREKYHFYNPILQNNKHISELKKQLLQFYDVAFYSVIVFYGNCRLKEIDFVPNGTFVAKSDKVIKVVRKILKENNPVNYTNESEVLRTLRESVANGAISENRIKHHENIKDMLGEHRVFD